MRVPGQSAKSAMFSRYRRIFFCGKSQRRPKVRRGIDRFRMPSSHEDGTFFRTSRSGPRKNLFRSPGTDAQERTRIHLRITAQISPLDREILSLPHRIRSTGIRKKQEKELLQSTGKNRHVFRRGTILNRNSSRSSYRSGVQKRAFFLTTPGKPIHNAASC